MESEVPRNKPYINSITRHFRQTFISANVGSDSLKIKVYQADPGHEPKHVASAEAANLLRGDALLTYESHGRRTDEDLDERTTREQALRSIVNRLLEDEKLWRIKSTLDIKAVCHRIPHGGRHDEPVVITTESVNQVEEVREIAPLFNNPALSVVEECLNLLPHAKNVLQFDTYFHRTIDEDKRGYMVNPEATERLNLRRSGAHGISYSYCVRHAYEYMLTQRRGFVDQRPDLIAFHLGDVSSGCTIFKGKSVDTTAGLHTSGLPGAYSCGTVDASLVFHLGSNANNTAMGLDEAMRILNFGSGWHSLTSTPSFATIAETQRDRIEFPIRANSDPHDVPYLPGMFQSNILEESVDPSFETQEDRNRAREGRDSARKEWIEILEKEKKKREDKEILKEVIEEEDKERAEQIEKELTEELGLEGREWEKDRERGLYFKDPENPEPPTLKELDHDREVRERIRKARHRAQASPKPWRPRTHLVPPYKDGPEPPPHAKLAFDAYVDAICHYASRAWQMMDGFVDAIVFTGAIGHNSALLRRTLIDKLGSLEIALDYDLNEQVNEEDNDPIREVSSIGSFHKVLVVLPDEEAEMARVWSLDMHCGLNDAQYDALQENRIQFVDYLAHKHKMDREDVYRTWLQKRNSDDYDPDDEKSDDGDEMHLEERGFLEGREGKMYNLKELANGIFSKTRQKDGGKGEEGEERPVSLYEQLMAMYRGEGPYIPRIDEDHGDGPKITSWDEVFFPPLAAEPSKAMQQQGSNDVDMSNVGDTEGEQIETGSSEDEWEDSDEDEEDESSSEESIDPAALGEEIDSDVDYTTKDNNLTEEERFQRELQREKDWDEQHDIETAERAARNVELERLIKEHPEKFIDIPFLEAEFHTNLHNEQRWLLKLHRELEKMASKQIRQREAKEPDKVKAEMGKLKRKGKTLIDQAVDRMVKERGPQIVDAMLQYVEKKKVKRAEGRERGLFRKGGEGDTWDYDEVVIQAVQRWGSTRIKGTQQTKFFGLEEGPPDEVPIALYGQEGQELGKTEEAIMELRRRGKMKEKMPVEGMDVDKGKNGELSDPPNDMDEDDGTSGAEPGPSTRLNSKRKTKNVVFAEPEDGDGKMDETGGGVALAKEHENEEVKDNTNADDEDEEEGEDDSDVSDESNDSDLPMATGWVRHTA